MCNAFTHFTVRTGEYLQKVVCVCVVSLYRYTSYWHSQFS